VTSFVRLQAVCSEALATVVRDANASQNREYGADNKPDDANASPLDAIAALAVQGNRDEALRRWLLWFKSTRGKGATWGALRMLALLALFEEVQE
jgi:thioredoxin-like negative regulator of GroEL